MCTDMRMDVRVDVCTRAWAACPTRHISSYLYRAITIYAVTIYTMLYETHQLILLHIHMTAMTL